MDSPLEKQKGEHDLLFIVLTFIAYTSVSAGRYNFSASIVSLVDAFGTTKAQIGLVASLFAIPYGIGQFVNAFISSRYNERLVVFAALAVSAAANFLMAFCQPVAGMLGCDPIAVMRCLWIFNGAVQSFVWCSIIKTIAAHVSDRAIPNAILISSITYPFGNFLAYVAAATAARFDHWQIAFLAPAAMLALSALLWIVFYRPSYRMVGGVKRAAANGRRHGAGWLAVVFVTLSCVAGFAAYFIKDGIGNWLPTIIHERFDLSKAAAITITLSLPLVSVFASAVNKWMYRVLPNHALMNMAAFIATVAACATTVIALATGSIFLAIAGCITMFFTMGMVSNIVTSMIPLNFRSKMDSGFLAGFIDTFCYVGTATSAFSLGKLADLRGWNAAFYAMLAVAAAAVLLSLFTSHFERRLVRE